MKRVLIVLLVALALPAAAQAKGVQALAVCGPDECRDAALHRGAPLEPFDLARGDRTPPPGPYYELRLTFDHGPQSRGIYYEPRSGLASYAEDVTRTAWAPLVPAFATAVKDAARGLAAFPTPKLTSVTVGDRQVADDASSYLRLFVVEGPAAAPGLPEELDWIRLEFFPDENPWTGTVLGFYPSAGVLSTGAGYVRLPARLAADVRAARPLGSGGGDGTTVPWIALGTGLAGALTLLLLARRRLPERKAAPVH